MIGLADPIISQSRVMIDFEVCLLQEYKFRAKLSQMGKNLVAFNCISHASNVPGDESDRARRSKYLSL